MKGTVAMELILHNCGLESDLAKQGDVLANRTELDIVGMAGEGHFYCDAHANQQSDHKNTKVKHKNAGRDKGMGEGTSIMGAVATKLQTITYELKGLLTMEGLWTVRLHSEDCSSLRVASCLESVCTHKLQAASC